MVLPKPLEEDQQEPKRGLSLQYCLRERFRITALDVDFMNGRWRVRTN